MGIKLPYLAAARPIAEVAVGEMAVGGQDALPFHWFEGNFPNPLRIGFEVWDVPPADWPEALGEVYAGVWGDPVVWARRVVEEFKADFVYLRLMSADPSGAGRAAAEAAAAAGRVGAALTDVPLIVVGPGDPAMDAEVAEAVAPLLSGRRALLGLAEEANYQALAAAALRYGHGVIANSPIDVNLAKQLNVLLTRLGLEESRLVMDPTSAALGYGLEYSYSVFERSRLAALVQGDEKMAVPMIAVVGPETWKVKESRATALESPGTGDATVRGVLWEAVTSIALANAGADLVVVRHPRSAELLRATASALLGG